MGKEWAVVYFKIKGGFRIVYSQVIRGIPIVPYASGGILLKIICRSIYPHHQRFRIAGS